MHEFHTVTEELEELEKEEDVRREEEEYKTHSIHSKPHRHTQTLEDTDEKIFYFIRHGTTVTNEILEGVDWGDPTFKEPYIMTDTRLSEKGQRHAIEVHHQIMNNLSLMSELQDLEVVIASPLTRTLQTVQYVFHHTKPLLPEGIKKFVHPILRERLYMTADTGRLRHELEAEFADWDFSALPHNEEWWYKHDEESHPPYEEWRTGEYYCKGEPELIFIERMKQLREWLLARPEKKILVVAHWGVFHCLTRMDFKNCQMRKITSSELTSTDLNVEYV